jgi:acetyl-CoA carboxylase biotin carboxyl carrier protein
MLYFKKENGYKRLITTLKFEEECSMYEIKSIITGIVLAVPVQKGEQVFDGQEVVIIESMKMAIPIESGHSGKVEDIRVKVGDFVNENDVLLTIV